MQTPWGWRAGGPNDISGEIFRKHVRSANCRCSRQRRPIGVAPGRAGGGQPRLKRGHSQWSCQSSVRRRHAHSSCSLSVFPVASTYHRPQTSSSSSFARHSTRVYRSSVAIDPRRRDACPAIFSVPDTGPSPGWPLIGDAASRRYSRCLR